LALQTAWDGLTCHELEGLGLHGLIGIGFRNGTHFEYVRLKKPFRMVTGKVTECGGWEGRDVVRRRKMGRFAPVEWNDPVKL
jgi:hypothetical protein